jgi:hypothetical protein
MDDEHGPLSQGNSQSAAASQGSSLAFSVDDDPFGDGYNGGVFDAAELQSRRLLDLLEQPEVAAAVAAIARAEQAEATAAMHVRIEKLEARVTKAETENEVLRQKLDADCGVIAAVTGSPVENVVYYLFVVLRWQKEPGKKGSSRVSNLEFTQWIELLRNDGGTDEVKTVAATVLRNGASGKPSVGFFSALRKAVKTDMEKLCEDFGLAFDKVCAPSDSLSAAGSANDVDAKKLVSDFYTKKVSSAALMESLIPLMFRRQPPSMQNATVYGKFFERNLKDFKLTDSGKTVSEALNGSRADRLTTTARILIPALLAHVFDERKVVVAPDELVRIFWGASEKTPEVENRRDVIHFQILDHYAKVVLPTLMPVVREGASLSAARASRQSSSSEESAAAAANTPPTSGRKRSNQGGKNSKRSKKPKE